MSFGMRGDITDLITHAKFYGNRFWDSDTPNLHYSI